MINLDYIIKVKNIMLCKDSAAIMTKVNLTQKLGSISFCDSGQMK